MPDTPNDNYVFIAIPLVAEALKRLLNARIHPQFAGYLALCRSAREVGRLENLPLRMKDFFDSFFRASGLPDTTPYIHPFGAHKRSPFFNANVAGSYAPSSLRPVAPLRQVAEMPVDRAQNWALKPDHAIKAKLHLTFKEPVDVISLATFLYRDYGIRPSANSRDGLVRIFRDEFGFRREIDSEQTNFDVLFKVI
jgi:hypothetical protein